MIAAGAIGSPQLLMLSGIGPATEGLKVYDAQEIDGSIQVRA